jgi:hypothetical protein
MTISDQETLRAVFAIANHRDQPELQRPAEQLIWAVTAHNNGLKQAAILAFNRALGGTSTWPEAMIKLQQELMVALLPHVEVPDVPPARCPACELERAHARCRYNDGLEQAALVVLEDETRAAIGTGARERLAWLIRNKKESA